LSDIDASKTRILEFVRTAVEQDEGALEQRDEKTFRLSPGGSHQPLVCTLDRDLAQNDEEVELIGIDHPLVNRLMNRWRKTEADAIGSVVKLDLGQDVILTMWLVQAYGTGTDVGTYVIPLAVDFDGKRVPAVEKRYSECFRGVPGKSRLGFEARQRLLHDFVDPTLQRELGHRGIAARTTGYSAEMIAWIEII
jgi:hypothetical protein